MNILKEKYITFLRQQYLKYGRRNILRKLLKYLIGDDRIQINYGKVNLFVQLNSSIEHAVFFDEYNEKYLLELISYFASQSYTFVDVGSNVGIHSLIASKSNNEIEIFSFEPEPSNFKAFIQNIGYNSASNIKPFCLGVGDFNGIVKMNINPGCNKGKHSLKIKFEDNTKAINIPIIKLDLFNDLIIADDVMFKIDVEGFEKEVITGAHNLLSTTKNSIIIIELLEETSGDLVCKEIIDILRTYNFITICKIRIDGIFDIVNNFQGSGDYIFLKGDKTLNTFNTFNK